MLIVPCINVPTPSEKVFDSIKYIIDQENRPAEKLELPQVDRLYPNCTNSVFNIYYPDQSELPDSFMVEFDSLKPPFTVSFTIVDGIDATSSSTSSSSP